MEERGERRGKRKLNEISWEENGFTFPLDSVEEHQFYWSLEDMKGLTPLILETSQMMDKRGNAK